MGWFCCVPGCSKRSERDKDVSFHRLPLRNKKLLKVWVHKIGRKNLSVNTSTRVCSRHFIGSKGRKLRPDEYPTLNLPILSTQATQPQKRKSPKKRVVCLTNDAQNDVSPESSDSLDYNEKYAEGNNSVDMKDVSTLTDVVGEEIEALVEECEILRRDLAVCETKLNAAEFRVSSVMYDDKQIQFYTGFASYKLFKACYDFLGPAVDNLTYWDSSKNAESIAGGEKGTKGRHRKLSPIDEFFLVMIRLRLGLLEKDLAYRCGVSQPTVSRILITWINFLYLQFQNIPLWPTRAMVNTDMPDCFKTLYPSTRVILDATEIHVEKPSLPILQQATFSNYKNTNTYKALVGISPSGVITYVSNLYAGSISDKELTRCSGILDLLEQGDSVMADRGFDIQDDLTLRGVRLNIPPFLKGRSQLTESELVETRRIASIRIHVERAMERIKNFHIFDRTLPSSMSSIANQTFFVCAVLSNFHPPLCT